MPCLWLSCDWFPSWIRWECAWIWNFLKIIELDRGRGRLHMNWSTQRISSHFTEKGMFECEIYVSAWPAFAVDELSEMGVRRRHRTWAGPACSGSSLIKGLADRLLLGGLEFSSFRYNNQFDLVQMKYLVRINENKSVFLLGLLALPFFLHLQVIA